MMHLRNRYPHNMQSNDYDCSVACIKSIFEYHKFKVSYDVISNIILSDDNGVSIKKIQSFMDIYGVKVKCYTLPNVFGLFQRIYNKSQFPCMALVEQGDLLHYITIYDIKRGIMTYSDPEMVCVLKTKSYDYFNNIRVLITFNFEDFHYENTSVEKREHNFLFRIVLNERKLLLIITLISFITSIMEIFLASKTGIYVDIINLKMNGSVSSIYFLIFIVGILFVLLIVHLNNYVNRQLSIRCLRNVEVNINSYVIKELLKREYKNYKYLNTGEITARLNDCNIMTSALTNFLMFIFSDLIILLVMLFVMNKINTFLLSTVLFIMICNTIFSIMFYKKIYVKNFYSLQKYSKFYGCLVELTEQFPIIKIFKAEKFFEKRLGIIINEYRDKATESDSFSNNVNTLQTFLASLAPITIMLFGYSYVISKQLSLGNLIIYVTLATIVQSIIIKFIQFQLQFESLLISYRRISQVFNQNFDKQMIFNEEDVYAINFENFSIKFKTNTVIEASNILLNCKNVILSGKSGAGKSTVAKCIAGLEQNYDGEIKINSSSSKNFNIIYLSTESNLFEGSIIDNLCLGADLDMDKVIKVCKDMDLYDYIMSLPNTFDYKIGINESNISTGQKQRIMIARTLLVNPQIIIFDESIFNIDFDSQKKIINNLQKYNLFLIFISHNKLDLPNSQTIIIHDKKMMDVNQI